MHLQQGNKLILALLPRTLTFTSKTLCQAASTAKALSAIAGSRQLYKQHTVTASTGLTAPLADCVPPPHVGSVFTDTAPTWMELNESPPRHAAVSAEVNGVGPPEATLQPETLNFWRFAPQVPPAPEHAQVPGQLRVSV